NWLDIFCGLFRQGIETDQSHPDTLCRGSVLDRQHIGPIHHRDQSCLTSWLFLIVCELPITIAAVEEHQAPNSKTCGDTVGLHDLSERHDGRQKRSASCVHSKRRDMYPLAGPLAKCEPLCRYAQQPRPWRSWHRHWFVT